MIFDTVVILLFFAIQFHQRLAKKALLHQLLDHYYYYWSVIMIGCVLDCVKSVGHYNAPIAYRRNWLVACRLSTVTSCLLAVACCLLLVDC